MGQILCARQSFFVGVRQVRAGALIDSDDPIVAGREALFTPIDAQVERATAAPGEVRTVRRAKKAAPKAD